jgi:hypothetical protein
MLLNKISKLEETNPADFWEVYNNLKELDTTHSENPIDPDEWVRHFKGLLSKIIAHKDPIFEEYVQDYVHTQAKTVFNELDFQIKITEIIEAIKSLKLNKAAGLDKITNEMLKNCGDKMISALTKLFNMILLQGCFPEIWRHNVLSPILKKGDVNSPENYRGIAVSSCLSKLFCQVLHGRLTKHFSKNSTIPIHQIGYKKKSRTSDHILTLKTLIDKYINKIPR